jgi:cytochrome b involved in lipid metabolism
MLARALFKSVARRMAPKAAKNTTINIARRYTTHKVNSAVGFGRSAILAGIGAGALGVGAYLFAPRSFAEDKIKQELTKTDEEEQENALFERAGSFRADLPVYSREDISKHNTMETRIWVTYKEGVYDITDFIEMHPGK